LGLGNLLDPEKMKMHLQKERELNDTPYGLRVLTQGTADHKFKKKAHKIEKQRRQKRKINNADAVAHLDSFFTEVSGLQKKSHVEKKPVPLKGMAENENPASANNATRGKDSLELTTMKNPEKKVKFDMKVTSKIETSKNGKVLDKSRRSSKIISMPPVTQKTLTHKNCFALEKESKFNSIWMGSDSDWTTLNIHLGMEPKESLRQAQKALEHYRTKLNDFWNIHGLTAGQGYGVDGQPWCTSHYSFHLVLWHIPLALSGQQYDAVQQRLTFEPKIKVPYALPFFTPFASGTVQARKLGNRVKYTVTVTSGRLDVKLLAVSRSMLPRNSIGLEQGEYVSWEKK